MYSLFLSFILLFLSSCSSMQVYYSQGEIIEKHKKSLCNKDNKKIKEGRLKSSSPDYKKKYDSEVEYLTESIKVESGEKLKLSTVCTTKTTMVSIDSKKRISETDLIPYFKEYSRQLEHLKVYAKKPESFVDLTNSARNVIENYSNPELVAIQCSRTKHSFESLFGKVGIKICFIQKFESRNNKYDAYQILFPEKGNDLPIHFSYLGSIKK